MKFVEKLTQHAYWVMLREKLKEKPKLAIFGLGFFLVLATYFVSKQQDIKTISYENQNLDFSNAKVISSNQDLYKRKDKIYTEKVQALEEKMDELTKKIDELSQNGLAAVPPSEEAQGAPPAPEAELPAPVFNHSMRPYPTTTVAEARQPLPQAPAPSMPAMASASPQPTLELPRFTKTGPSIISFPVKSKEREPDLGVSLPAGSFVKAKLLTGIEAPEGKALPVLMQADYAFVGPNKSRVDLSGCFLIAKSTGNLSIERVEMQVSKISCVAKSGKMFERDLSGYIADGKDNSFAVMGEVNSKQDRVAATAFLSSVVEGISKAIAQAQTTTTMNGAGGSNTTITGDQGKYIAAGGASNAASTVTQWYLKHAESLLPTINVGSGQDVWVIVQDSVALPNWYFESHRSSDGSLSFFSNFMK